MEDFVLPMFEVRPRRWRSLRRRAGHRTDHHGQRGGYAFIKGAHFGGGAGRFQGVQPPGSLLLCGVNRL